MVKFKRVRTDVKAWTVERLPQVGEMLDKRLAELAALLGDKEYLEDAVEARRHFGGTPAPVLHLRLDGDRAVLA